MGLGISEIRNFIWNILADKCVWNQAVQLLNVQEDVMLAETLDTSIDDAAVAGNPWWILRHYKDFLEIRAQRKEYRLNSKQQVIHFLSVARNYCTLLQK